MTNPTCNCFDSADVGIAAEEVSDDLIFNTVLLGSESKRGGPSLSKLSICCGVKWESSVPNSKLDIAKGEWSGLRW